MLRVVFLALIIVFSAAPAELLAATPFSSVAKIDADLLRKEVGTPARLGRRFKPVRVSLRKVSGVGNVMITLNKRKLPSAQACFVGPQGECVKDKKLPILFRGTVTFAGGRGAKRIAPAAASVIDNRVRIQFAIPSKRPHATRNRVYAIEWRLGEIDAVSAKVHGVPSAALIGKDCGSSRPDRESHVVSARATVERTVETYRVLTISTDADPEWYARYGENSNVEIAAIVNAAEAIYERQLGIRFSLVRQHVYTTASPYVDTDASKLLASFAKNPENPANLGFSPLTFDQDVDLKHLFTGKDLNGSTVGLSYIGALCWASASSYGLTQNTNRELNSAIFAHEIGHSLGAQHDTTDPGSLMYPTIGPKTYFSSESLRQMNQLMASFGECVSHEQLHPNLTTASLTLKRSFSKDRRTLKFRGKLISASLRPIAGETVRLSLNKKQVLLMTNAKGEFSYVIKTRNLRKKKLVVFAQTVNSETAIPAALRVLVNAKAVGIA